LQHFLSVETGSKFSSVLSLWHQLQLTAPIPLLLHGVHSSSLLSLRQLHLRRPHLLLRGRPQLLLSSLFSVVTHLRPWSVTSTSESHGLGHITSRISLTLLLLLLLSLDMLDTHYLIPIGSMLCTRS
jgi:hypothetical protein